MFNAVEREECSIALSASVIHVQHGCRCIPT